MRQYQFKNIFRILYLDFVENVKKVYIRLVFKKFSDGVLNVFQFKELMIRNLVKNSGKLCFITKNSEIWFLFFFVQENLLERKFLEVMTTLSIQKFQSSFMFLEVSEKHNFQFIFSQSFNLNRNLISQFKFDAITETVPVQFKLFSRQFWICLQEMGFSWKGSLSLL